MKTKDIKMFVMFTHTFLWEIPHENESGENLFDHQRGQVCITVYIIK